MRAVFGVVGLVVALAVVGWVAKKQMAAVRTPVHSLPQAAEPAATARMSPTSGTVRDQSQQIQQQVRQQVEGLLQQARPALDEEN